MNKLICNLFQILLVSAVSLPVVDSQGLSPSKNSPVAGAIHRQTLTEEFSFAIGDFKMDHQGENNNLNISISYRYVANIAKSDYPDFRLLAKDVETADQ